MTRAVVTVLFAAGLAVGPVLGQGRPNFSGTWTLVSSVPDNTWAMGKRFVASQDDTSLLIEIPEAVQHVSFESRTGGGTTSTSLGPPQQLRELYHLDGSEVKRTFPDPPAPRQGTVITGGTEESASTATWQDQQLVIVTKNVIKNIWWSRGGDVVRTHQTVRNALRLEPDGTLVVDHQITVDRAPDGGTGAGGGQPAPIRSVYQRMPGR